MTASLDIITVRGRRIVIRNAKPQDQTYVARTWVASASDGHAHQRHALRENNGIVDRLLDDKSTRILIACEPEDYNRIIGWVAFAGGLVRVLLYVNVRNGDRKQGVGGCLLDRAGLTDESLPIAYLWNGASSSWLKAKRPNAVHMTPQEYLNA